mmetsp:Transcript_37146/g.59669  ORF Transcript_37146/g.59669 Transcript_37146/m.59669 type:complete len:236 (-) Transcript_37146:841-1548(-)
MASSLENIVLVVKRRYEEIRSFVDIRPIVDVVDRIIVNRSIREDRDSKGRRQVYAVQFHLEGVASLHARCVLCRVDSIPYARYIDIKRLWSCRLAHHKVSVSTQVAFNIPDEDFKSRLIVYGCIAKADAHRIRGRGNRNSRYDLDWERTAKDRPTVKLYVQFMSSRHQRLNYKRVCPVEMVNYGGVVYDRGAVNLLEEYRELAALGSINLQVSKLITNLHVECERDTGVPLLGNP